jgi:hypothetical protein
VVATEPPASGGDAPSCGVTEARGTTDAVVVTAEELYAVIPILTDLDTELMGRIIVITLEVWPAGFTLQYAMSSAPTLHVVGPDGLAHDDLGNQYPVSSSCSGVINHLSGVPLWQASTNFAGAFDTRVRRLTFSGITAGRDDPTPELTDLFSLELPPPQSWFRPAGSSTPTP